MEVLITAGKTLSSIHILKSSLMKITKADLAVLTKADIRESSGEVAD